MNCCRHLALPPINDVLAYLIEKYIIMLDVSNLL